MTKVPQINPFTKKDTLLTVVKDLETRWGLTLVSFLPKQAQGQIKLLESKIKDLPSVPKVTKQEKLSPTSTIDPPIEFYGLHHLHCTHYTLTRSTGWGPVCTQRFLKDGHKLVELFEIIHDNTSRMPSIEARLDKLRMNNGRQIILFGRCSDETSVDTRRDLLKSLNTNLAKGFDISPRDYDKDPSKFHKLHCRIGFLKRPMPDYRSFADDFNNLIWRFTPISFTLKSVTIVHHRNRLLRPPHEGCFSFPLGKDISQKVTAHDFERKLNLKNHCHRHLPKP
jgi:hypothetical protein